MVFFFGDVRSLFAFPPRCRLGKPPFPGAFQGAEAGGAACWAHPKNHFFTSKMMIVQYL